MNRAWDWVVEAALFMVSYPLYRFYQWLEKGDEK